MKKELSIDKIIKDSAFIIFIATVSYAIVERMYELINYFYVCGILSYWGINAKYLEFQFNQYVKLYMVVLFLGYVLFSNFIYYHRLMYKIKGDKHFKRYILCMPKSPVIKGKSKYRRKISEERCVNEKKRTRRQYKILLRFNFLYHLRSALLWATLIVIFYIVKDVHIEIVDFLNFDIVDLLWCFEQGGYMLIMAFIASVIMNSPTIIYIDSKNYKFKYKSELFDKIWLWVSFIGASLVILSVLVFLLGCKSDYLEHKGKEVIVSDGDYFISVYGQGENQILMPVHPSGIEESCKENSACNQKDTFTIKGIEHYICKCSYQITDIKGMEIRIIEQ